MFSSTVTGGQDATATQYNNVRKDVVFNAGDFAATTGSSNAYVLSIDTAVAALTNGWRVRLTVNFTNTATATLAVNGLTAKTIVDSAGTALVGGELVSSYSYELVYLSGPDKWQLVGSVKVATAPTVSTGSGTLAVNTVYIANGSTQIIFTLPTTAAVNDYISIDGKGIGGYKIAQPASVSILDGYYTSTVGTSGFWLPANPYDCITLRCITANTGWVVEDKTNGNVDTGLGWDDPMALGNVSAFAGSSYIGAVSDDRKFNVYANNATNGDLILWRGAFGDNQEASPFTHNTQNRQKVGANTIKGSSFTPNSRPVIRNGYIYWGKHDELYRCAVTSDITVGGNWAAMTEATFPSSANGYLVGFAFDHFWFKSTTNANDFFRATLSGTTFTYVDTITLSGSGSTSDPERNMVNEKGIYVRRGTASTSSNPDVVFANHAGTIDATIECEDWIFAGTKYSVYSFLVSSGESVNKIIKVMS